MKQEPQKENMLMNLLISIAVPTIILMKFSGEEHLGPVMGLVVALAFPVIYGLYDFARQKKVNFFSAMGVVSILLTGGMALLKLPPQYIAIKEAAIPTLFGIAVMVSLKTRYPLVRTFLYNDKIMQIEKVNAALDEKNNHQAFERVLYYASCMFAASFFLSAVLNFALAKYLLVSEPGTEQFNQELGAMTAWSIPVITVPSMIVTVGALFYLLSRIKRLTALNFEDIFAIQE